MSATSAGSSSESRLRVISKRFLDAMLEIRREADRHGFRGFQQRFGTSRAMPVGALKSLARVALLLMPESQLEYFGDTIEWVSNPEHERDAGSLESLLSRGFTFRMCRCPRPSVTLVRKTYEDAPFPYVVLFLGTTELMIQVPVPYCVRDDDRDGELEPMPRLSLACGHGHDFRDSLCLSVPVEGGATWRAGRTTGHRGEGMTDWTTQAASSNGQQRGVGSADDER